MEPDAKVIDFPTKNLRGFNFMQMPINELLRHRVLRDAGTERTAAWLRLICAGFHEDPPGSLPDNDRWLAEAAGLYLDEWEEIRGAVMRDWYVGEDGRLRTLFLDRMTEAAMTRKRGNTNGGHVRADRKAEAA